MTSPTLPRGMALLALLALAPAAATAQAGAAAHSLTGTWALTAADEIGRDGVRRQSYGPEPQGLLIIDADGRYSLQLFRRDRRRFASGSKRQGTADEYADAVLGMSSHVGRCLIDSITGTLIFRIELASFPNWEGTEQRRTYTLTADRLAYRIPPSATGDGTIAISEWRRLR